MGAEEEAYVVHLADACGHAGLRKCCSTIYLSLNQRRKQWGVTSQTRGTFTEVAIHAVHACSTAAGVWFAVVNIFLAKFSVKSIWTQAQVFTEAWREFNIGNTRSTIEAAAGLHSNLRKAIGRCGKIPPINHSWEVYRYPLGRDRFAVQTS